MARIEFLRTNEVPGAPVFLFAHGAGSTMETVFMATVAEGLGIRGIGVARFEFAYMAARRVGGPKRPPPKVGVLEQEFHAAVADLAPAGPLIIGGKSMGGRVASLCADAAFDAGLISGLLCLGYPFHPRGKPETLRTGHLGTLKVPTLICQGTRDPFGTQEEVAGYDLSKHIALSWIEDGDHDLKPRKRVTGVDHAAQLDDMCARIARWVAGL